MGAANCETNEVRGTMDHLYHFFGAYYAEGKYVSRDGVHGSGIESATPSGHKEAERRKKHNKNRRTPLARNRGGYIAGWRGIAGS